MYKHVITYRYRIDSSQISSVKKLEIVAEERISMDGPGIWKTKCKNFISAKTGIDASQVIDNESHFRIDFSGNVSAENGGSESKNVKNAPNPEAVAEAKKAEAEASARKAEAKSVENSAKWETYAKLGTAAFSAATSTGKEVKETTDYLSKMIFSDDPNELANQLSEICSSWGGAEKYMLADNTKAVKKAAFDKFEYGMLKLQQIGTPSQIDFFAKKQKEMKPKKFFGLF
jgi:hypothetical protein